MGRRGSCIAQRTFLGGRLCDTLLAGSPVRSLVAPTMWTRIRHPSSGLLALLIPFLVYMFTLDGTVASNGVDASIIATQYALWKTGHLSIGAPGHVLLGTVDYGVYRGVAYSAIAPGTALLSYPFAAAALALVGGPLVFLGPVQLADELFLAAAASVAVYFFYRICRLYSDERVSLFLALVLAFSTPLWPFTTVVFENAPSLMFAATGTYFVFTSARNRGKTRLAFFGGLLVGLASFVEYAAALLVVPLVVFEAHRTRSTKSAAALILGFALGLAPNLLFNFLLFGNPLIFPEQLKSGTPRPLTGVFSAFNPQLIPLHIAYYLVSPYRGALFYSPILLAGLYAACRNLRSHALRQESAAFLSMGLVVLVFYSAWFDWSGGLAYGPRFLTLASPYLLAPLAPRLAAGVGKHEQELLVFLALYGTFIQGVGALTTPFSVGGDPATFQPLALNVPLLLQGKLDTWWIWLVGLGETAAPRLFEAALYFFVWVVTIVVAERALTKSASGDQTLEGGEAEIGAEGETKPPHSPDTRDTEQWAPQENPAHMIHTCGPVAGEAW